MRIVLIAFEGAQGLDIFGPAEVFSAAARGPSHASYRIELASVRGGSIHTTSGLEIGTSKLTNLRPRRGDTVLVVGGDEAAVRAALRSRALTRWLTSAGKIVGRIGSVCSGAFLLARAGLLDGRRVATHWSACARLAEFRPLAKVDADAIFVRDGHLWTSAGVTTGIDLALAMVEEDCGRAVADDVAARLVVYARRPASRRNSPTCSWPRRRPPIPWRGPSRACAPPRRECGTCSSWRARPACRSGRCIGGAPRS